MSQTPPEEILGLGTDIIELKRIKEAVERHGKRFLARIFTDQERAYCEQHKDPTARFAGRFAAKEAIAKAFGTGFGEELSWKEIEVCNDAHGKPEVYLSERLKRSFPRTRLFVSISHCENYATATAILSGVR